MEDQYVDSILIEPTNLCSKWRYVIISHDQTYWIAFLLWLFNVQMVKCHRPSSLPTQSTLCCCHGSLPNLLPVLLSLWCLSIYRFQQTTPHKRLIVPCMPAPILPTDTDVLATKVHLLHSSIPTNSRPPVGG